MNPADALNVLIQAASLARLTKMEHIQIEQAAQALAAFVNEHVRKAEDKPPLGPRAIASEQPVEG
jgi:uncharacterized protein (UPF0261 family)